MALAELLEALERDGRARVEAEIEAARAEARRTASESEARIASRRRQVLADVEAELRATGEAELAEARRRARIDVLTSRQRLLDRVFAAVEERLTEVIGSAAYAAALRTDLAEAMSHLGDAAAVVRCPPALAPRVRSEVAGRDHIAVQSEEGAPLGIIVAARDGSVEIDATLTRRLLRLRPQLGIELLQRIGVEK